MRYTIPRMTESDIAGHRCSKASCGDRATWALTYGYTVDDVTESCNAHVAELLGDAPLLDAASIGASAIPDRLFIKIDTDGETPKVIADGAYGMQRGPIQDIGVGQPISLINDPQLGQVVCIEVPAGRVWG